MLLFSTSASSSVSYHFCERGVGVVLVVLVVLVVMMVMMVLVALR